MNKNNNKKFFLGLTVAVLLPFSFYIIAKMLGKDKLAMPRYYNVASVNGPSDTVYHRVADVGFINQFGDHIRLNSDLRGKILVIEVFFAQCGSVCPKLTGNMAILQKAFKRND
ncbi:MAG: SCO family protein [Chitinophagaceae bacterium]